MYRNLNSSFKCLKKALTNLFLKLLSKVGEGGGTKNILWHWALIRHNTVCVNIGIIKKFKKKQMPSILTMVRNQQQTTYFNLHTDKIKLIQNCTDFLQNY